jgi:hypothetical protein
MGVTMNRLVHSLILGLLVLCVVYAAITHRSAPVPAPEPALNYQRPVDFSEEAWNREVAALEAQAQARRGPSSHARLGPLSGANGKISAFTPCSC